MPSVETADLIGIRVTVVSLHVHLLWNATLAVDVTAAANALVEPKIPHQRSQFVETDVCVGPAGEDGAEQPLVPVHLTSPSPPRLQTSTIPKPC